MEVPKGVCDIEGAPKLLLALDGPVKVDGFPNGDEIPCSILALGAVASLSFSCANGELKPVVEPACEILPFSFCVPDADCLDASPLPVSRRTDEALAPRPLPLGLDSRLVVFRG
jgi:hypothetical protein